MDSPRSEIVGSKLRTVLLGMEDTQSTTIVIDGKQFEIMSHGFYRELMGRAGATRTHQVTKWV